MKEFKGTKGPWVVKKSIVGDWGDKGALSINANGKWIELATFYKHPIGSDKQHIYNAALCAAAPYLLEACINAVKLWEDAGMYDGEPYTSMKAAISKALNTTSYE